MNGNEENTNLIRLMTLMTNQHSILYVVIPHPPRSWFSAQPTFYSVHCHSTSTPILVFCTTNILFCTLAFHIHPDLGFLHNQHSILYIGISHPPRYWFSAQPTFYSVHWHFTSTPILVFCTTNILFCTLASHIHPDIGFLHNQHSIMYIGTPHPHRSWFSAQPTFYSVHWHTTSTPILVFCTTNILLCTLAHHIHPDLGFCTEGISRQMTKRVSGHPRRQ